MKFKITINESTASYLTSKSGELIAKILNANYKSGTGVEYTIDGKNIQSGKFHTSVSMKRFGGNRINNRLLRAIMMAILWSLYLIGNRC